MAINSNLNTNLFLTGLGISVMTLALNFIPLNAELHRYENTVFFGASNPFAVYDCLIKKVNGNDNSCNLVNSIYKASRG